jgi:hypothetical protein
LKFRFAMFISIVFAFCGQVSSGQAVRNGVGDATTIVAPERVFGASGNPNEIGDFSTRASDQDTGAFVTRHMRSGESSGIGGSFLGTTNVTAESSPARAGRIPETAVRALIPTSSVSRPQTQLFSQSLTRPVSTALPAMSPDISSQWNASSPALGGASNPALMDFSVGHKQSPSSKSFSHTMGLPSFDSY